MKSDRSTPDVSPVSRRKFIAGSAVAAGAISACQVIPTAVHAAGNDTLKLGLIGCGGRGSGAVRQACGLTKALSSQRWPKLLATACKPV